MSDFVGIITSIILIYVVRFYYKYFTRPNPLPGPFPLPFVGNLLQVIYFAKGDRLEWIKLQSKKYGDLFEIYLGEPRRIMLGRADYVEKLMSTTKKSNYIKKSANSSSGPHELASRGILFNNDIPTWRFNRQFLTQAILSPSFSKDVLCWTPMIFKELKGYWKEIGDEPIDFAIWIHKFTTEIIFQLIVGIKVNALVRCYNDNVEPSKMKHIQPNPIDKEIENFAELVYNELSYYEFALTYPSFLRHTVLKKRNNELYEKRNKTIKLVKKVIDHRRNEIEQTPMHEELKHDMLTSLITANTERDINKHQHNYDEEFTKPLTNDQINQILLESITGGIDTTANLMCYIIYYLCHYPDVLVRLRQELDSIFGSDPNSQITMEDLSKMHYTEAIIKECSRLVNTVKNSVRVSTLPDTVAGYEWPANTTFHAYFEGIHHNPTHWKEPHKFNPDRFMESDPQKNTFLMFGGGSRICPGRKMALIEVKCLISLIYRNMDISLVDMNAPLKLKNKVVNICTELKVRVKQKEMDNINY